MRNDAVRSCLRMSFLSPVQSLNSQWNRHPGAVNSPRDCSALSNGASAKVISFRFGDPRLAALIFLGPLESVGLSGDAGGAGTLRRSSTSLGVKLLGITPLLGAAFMRNGVGVPPSPE